MHEMAASEFEFSNYHNSRYYPSSCLSFKTRRFGNWNLSLSLGEPAQLCQVDRANHYHRTMYNVHNYNSYTIVTKYILRIFEVQHA
jgi:hypothetical protein